MSENRKYTPSGFFVLFRLLLLLRFPLLLQELLGLFALLFFDPGQAHGPVDHKAKANEAKEHCHYLLHNREGIRAVDQGIGEVHQIGAPQGADRIGYFFSSLIFHPVFFLLKKASRS